MFGKRRDKSNNHNEPNNRGVYFDPILDQADTSAPTFLEYDADPLLRLERDRKSSRYALGFAISVPLVTFLVGFVIAITSRTLGGPLCVAGKSTWICSRTFEILFPVVPGSIALLGVLIAAWITYRTWANYGRWRPWLAIIWFLMPFSLTWLTGFGTMAVVGQH